MYNEYIMKRLLTLLFISMFLCSGGAEVFFVPGWRTGYSARAVCVRIMHDIWPGIPVKVKSWNSLVSLNEAKVNAENYTGTLLSEILAMPDARRRELILAGHSIGAVIVLEILKELDKRDLKIHSAALLGAPVANDDPGIFRALNAVRGICCNIAFSGDGVLRVFYPFSGSGDALGVAGWQYKHPRFIERCVKQPFSFYHHYAYRYLEELDDLLDSQPERAVVEIKDGCIPHFCDETGLFWNTEAEYCRWQLQKHLFNGKFRLLDPEKRIRKTGSGSALRTAFDAVKKQLSVSADR